MDENIKNESSSVISVKDAFKEFKVYFDRGRTLKEMTLFAGRRKHEIREVLKGISFEIPKGQAVGLIGKNGCGKSTTLKMLTKILKPTRGQISVEGRISSLIELGAGFHPDMSGRENIYINASIFGLKKKEIDERLEEIITFSELEEFIDNPVRTYSSGMYMRLAFAVAINVDADVLLVDEILAVGDVNFQKKCLDKLRKIKENGTTIMIVSHSMDQLKEICDRLIWIEDGKIKEDGDFEGISRLYLEEMESERLKRLAKESGIKIEDLKKDFPIEGLAREMCPFARREGNQLIYFTKFNVTNVRGEETRSFKRGEKFILTAEFDTKAKNLNANFNMDFVKDNWQYQYGSCFAGIGKELVNVKGKGKYIFTIEELNLLPGKYFLSSGINGSDGSLYDYLGNLTQICIEDEYTDEYGPASFKHSWEIV